jgi:DNA-directed RNA polymerase subunit L
MGVEDKMTTSRRNFLRQGTLLGLSTIATLSVANFTFGQSSNYRRPNGPGIFPVPEEVQYTTLDKLTRVMFANVLNSSFVIVHPVHGKVETYLKTVEDLSPPIFKMGAKHGIECFNLVFACQSDIEIHQGTYTLEHEKFGSFELFIVPGTRQRYGRDYNAIINRLFP